MGGYVGVRQLGAPTNVFNFVCVSGSTTYYYKVTSVNAAGQETTPSIEFNTTAKCANTVSSTNTIQGTCTLLSAQTITTSIVVQQQVGLELRD